MYESVYMHMVIVILMINNKHEHFYHIIALNHLITVLPTIIMMGSLGGAAQPTSSRTRHWHHIALSLSLSLYIYIYTHVCIGISRRRHGSRHAFRDVPRAQLTLKSVFVHGVLQCVHVFVSYFFTEFVTCSRMFAICFRICSHICITPPPGITPRGAVDDAPALHQRGGALIVRTLLPLSLSLSLSASPFLSFSPSLYLCLSLSLYIYLIYFSSCNDFPH